MSRLDPLQAELGRQGHRWVRILTIAILLDDALILGLLGNRIGSNDLDQFLVFHELQFWNAKLFECSKQWCPLLCSGLSLAAEPQVPVLSLSMLIGYATDPMWGIRLAILAYLGLGWLGAYLYSGLMLPQRPQRALAASLFVGNGFFICRIAHGHIDFIPLFIVPLVLYSLHRAVAWTREPRSPRGWARSVASALLLAAAVSMAIDGSPVLIVHGLFWIVLYGIVLAGVSRSPGPLILLASVLTLAAFMDAAYLWPMLAGQSEAPRLTQDQFTHPLALPWYMLMPLWGKFLLSANGKGHELSVFVGPVLAWLMWRHRRPLFKGVPMSLGAPLLIVGLISLWLGMGSLKPLGVPVALSPFDLLRPLPGFRSMGVTGRYWGFLALPLSLLSAGAVWCFLAERAQGPRVWLCLGFALTIQLGFQTVAILSKSLQGRPYHAVDWKSGATGDATDLRFLLRGELRQGEIVGPTRAVIDCYDEDDIPHARMTPGTRLVLAAMAGRPSPIKDVDVRGRFQTWNRIQLELISPRSIPSPEEPQGEMEILLNQAYCRFWESPDGDVIRGAENNLVLRCAVSRLGAGPVELVFRDPVSSQGFRTSLYSWSAWGVVLAPVALFGLGRFWRPANAEAGPRSTDRSPMTT